MHVPERASSVLEEAARFAVDIDGIEAIAGYLRRVVDDCSDYVRLLRAAGGELRSGRGASVVALEEKLGTRLRTGAEGVQKSADEARAGLREYQHEMIRICGTAQRVSGDVEACLGTIREAAAELESIEFRIGAHVLRSWEDPPPGLMPAPTLGAAARRLSADERDVAEVMLSQIYADRWLSAASRWRHALEDIGAGRRAWLRLISERRTAERRLSARLRATEIGRLIRFGRANDVQTPRQVIALSVAGEMRGRTGKVGILLSHPLLRALIGTESAEAIWNEAPNPVEVAANWDRLEAAEQQRLIAEAPWVVGNLPGLPFAVRDAANRNMIEFYGANPSALNERGLRVLRQLEELCSRSEEPQVSVVALDLSGDVPLAAIGYGDLDRADNVTWQVPGMESDADKALATWDAASRNLYEEQSFLLKDDVLERTTGVINYLEYDTPDLSDSLNEYGVLSTALARKGARRLAREIDGTWATRNLGRDVTPGFHTPGSPRIGVAAHSYGTTTAADALTLTRFEIDSFSMLGSAGLDMGVVDSLDALRVARHVSGRRAIYASHASEDRLAPIGLSAGNRANPTPGLHVDGAPRYSDALGFSSDGYRLPNGFEFEETDGHSVIGESVHTGFGGVKNAAGLESSRGHGYWDQKTQALRNLAASLLGMDKEIVGGVYVDKD